MTTLTIKQSLSESDLAKGINDAWPGAEIIEREYQDLDLTDQVSKFLLLILEHVVVSANMQGGIIQYMTRLVLKHPDSPITITYTLDLEEQAPDITLGGLFYGEPGDRRKAIRVVDYLVSPLSRRGPKPLDAYDQAFTRLLTGDDPVTVKEEFLEQNPHISDSGYKNAMYRRRQWLKGK
jgi:hypothetical protein